MDIRGRCRFEVGLKYLNLNITVADSTLGCSIWAVELLRREILKLRPDAKVNAILIDFFLYDLAKEREKEGVDAIPHHRTRSIWY